MSTGTIHGQAVHLKEKSTYLNEIIMGLIYFQRQDSILFLVPHFTSHSHLKHACYFTSVHDAAQCNEMWTCCEVLFS